MTETSNRKDIEAKGLVLRARLSSLISLFFGLLPIWWVLGLEQFIWPFAFGGLVLLLIYGRTLERRGIVFPAPARWALAFLVVQLFSSFFIVEPAWVLVFMRNFGLWLGGLCLFILVINLINFGSREFYALLGTVLLVSLLACVVGCLGVTGIFDPHFMSPLSHVLPSIVVDSEYARAMLVKSWTAAESTAIFGLELKRPRAFFIYPNPFAGFLVLTLPLTLFYCTTKRKRLGRWFWLPGVTLTSFAVLLTTSRAAIVSLIIGAVVLRHNLRPPLRFVLYTVIAGSLVVAPLLLLSRLPSAKQQSKEILEELITARGQSHRTRATVYAATLESWRDRPVFGWGTQRSPRVAGLSSNYPPLGSHSTYGAILYRHGIVGLLVYLAMMLSIYGRFRRRNLSADRTRFLVYARWAFVGNVAHAILLEVDLDATLLMTMWLLWALVILATNGSENDQPTQERRNAR